MADRDRMTKEEWMMKKLCRLLQILVVLGIALTAVYASAVTAHAETIDEGRCGEDLTWTLDDRGTLTISGMGQMWDFAEEMNRTPEWTHYSYDGVIKKLVIQDGVTTIGDSAFWGCRSLTSLELPDSLQRIEHGAFYYCEGLTAAELPEGVTYVGQSAFNSCAGLTTATLPSTVTYLGYKAFGNCSALGEVTICGSVPTFGTNRYGSTGDASLPFYGVTATVYYPAADGTWTSQMRRNYGGKLTWVPYSDVAVVATQPKNASGYIGGTVQFQVEGSGPDITYRWQYKTPCGSWADSTMTGANTDTLTVPVTAARNRYRYRCVITDAYGNQAVSDGAALTVKTRITVQPVSKSGCVGETVKPKVQAEGAWLTYQWQYRMPSTGYWSNSTFTGANTDTLTVPITAHRNKYQYRCVITDANGVKTYSAASTLKVKTKITAQPTSRSGKAGETVKFTVKATGAWLAYQWQYRTSSTGCWANSTFTGANTDTLSVPVAAFRNKYQYRCIITNANGTRTYSDAATLTVK